MRKLLRDGSVGAAFTRRLERAYQADLAKEKLRVFQQTYLLGAAMYIGFGVLDIWAVPGAVGQAWASRVAVVAITALALLVPRFRADLFNRFYMPITAALYLLWGAGVLLILAIAEPEDLASRTYYGGLVLVSFALYTWTYLRAAHAVAIGAVLGAGYVAIAVLHHGMGSAERVGELMTNCVILLGANVIGAFSRYTRERFSRQNFLLRHWLSQDLRHEERARLRNEYLSQHDGLTGLPNRMRFMSQLDELLAGSLPVAVLFLDLDNFKPINDVHGHAAGDHVLRCVAQRVRNLIRAGDLVGRLGGDEFVVALPMSEAPEAAVERLVAQLDAAIGQPIEFEGKLLKVEASIGAAQGAGTGRSAADLMGEADLRMYVNKRARRGGAGRAA